MICESLERYRYTGDRAEIEKLISWLMDRRFWFEVQFADEFNDDGTTMWEVVCGVSQLRSKHVIKSEEANHAQQVA